MENQTNCPLWLRFLNEVLPEKGKQEALRLFINAVSTRDYSKMLVLLGDGENGTSVIAEVIAGLFEPETSRVELSELMGKNECYNTAIIDRMKVNLCHGLEGIKVPKFKALLSGEQTMCRRPYGKPYLTTSLPMFICDTNNIPDKLNENIIRRRLIVIKFDVNITNQDLHLSEKLNEEKYGIWDWVMGRAVPKEHEHKTLAQLQFCNSIGVKNVNLPFSYLLNYPGIKEKWNSFMENDKTIR